MTIGVNVSNFDQFVGGQIGAFYDLNGDGELQCVGLETITTGFFGMALWGNDSSTPEQDGLASGGVPEFAILHEGNVVMVEEYPQFNGFVTNSIVNITDATLTIDQPGCNDPNACNYNPLYQDLVYTGENTCEYPRHSFLDCDGFTQAKNTAANMTIGINSPDFDQFIGGSISAIYDLNGDGNLQTVAWAETIIPGFFGIAIWGDDSSTPLADGLPSGAVPQFVINYEGQLIYLQETPQFTGYVTNGIEFITGSDFYSNECVDPNACNYIYLAEFDNVNYTNADCSYPGCLDKSYLEFNLSAGCSSPNMCLTPIVYGCTDASAFNFYPFANTDDGSCYPLIEGCTDPGAYNFNDYDLDGNYNELTGINTIDINTDDGSCVERVYGCIDECYVEFDQNANTDDGSCSVTLKDAYIELTQNHNDLKLTLDSMKITINLVNGWNMFGYGCPASKDAIESMSNHVQWIQIVKNNDAKVYWPEFEFNGIGDLIPGQGYQIKVTEAIEDFNLCNW